MSGAGRVLIDAGGPSLKGEGPSLPRSLFDIELRIAIADLCDLTLNSQHFSFCELLHQDGVGVALAQLV